VQGSDERVQSRLLFDLGTAFAARLELEELIPFVVRECAAALGAAGASVLLLTDDASQLYFPYVTATDAAIAERLLRLRIPADQGVAGAVVQSGQGLRIDQASSDARFNPEADRFTGFTTRAILCVPLRGRTGMLGVLQVVNPLERPSFDDADLQFLVALSGSVAVAIENARLYDTVRATASRLREQVGVLRRDVARLERGSALLGDAASMEQVRRLVQSAAASPITVLIEGETGTGKELVAREIHRTSPRAEGGFVAVNCAALSDTLLESELFGHKRGAFTGATHDRAGYFEAAAGGTIFLDEIGEMPLGMQAKLLRVLQENEVTPVGDHRPRKIDVRVIAATNRDLAADAASGRFRTDLYYRLAAFPIRLPRLGDRSEDVASLAEHFLVISAERHGKHIPGFLQAALTQLARWSWPGNVRELQNEVDRAVALAADGQRIGPDLLSPRLTGGEPAAVAAEAPAEELVPLRDARERFEVRYVASALKRFAGNVSHTAQALGISRVMLQKKMKQYGLRDD
jgi:Nif-specific regulatory protein